MTWLTMKPAVCIAYRVPLAACVFQFSGTKIVMFVCRRYLPQKLLLRHQGMILYPPHTSLPESADADADAMQKQCEVQMSGPSCRLGKRHF